MLEGRKTSTTPRPNQTASQIPSHALELATCSGVTSKSPGQLSHTMTLDSRQPRTSPLSNRPRRRKRGWETMGKTSALLYIMAAASTVMAQTESCISLSGSSSCSAFNASSVSIDSYMLATFPFLQGVTTVGQFDANISSYVGGAYDTLKYGTLLGCSISSLANTSSLYARYTTSVLCNAVVQNSISRCGLSTAASRPLCANDCSSFAESEANIVANTNLCSNPSLNSTQQTTQIRADFTNCALPAAALDASCISAVTNEPNNCGFASNTLGLCSYCGSGSVNSTDTCCYNSRAEQRCAGVVLPTITASIALSTSTASPTASASSSAAAAASGGSNGLSGGAIAGIVIGSIFGAALLIGLLFLCCLCLRRRRSDSSANGSVLNQPTPARKGHPQMAYNSGAAQSAPAGYEVLPGGRIARMSALEGHSGDSPPSRRDLALAGVTGAGLGYEGENTRHDGSSSDEYNYSPESDVRGGVLRPPPTGRRTGSLSSNSVLGFGDVPGSPVSGGGMSSPHALSSQQSEQLAFFKDYYSQDEIHPGNKVATLWAYQPRAADEFSLERGDMLKVIGIWDDGWATGVLVNETATEWDARRNVQRDSGVSNGGVNGNNSPAPQSGEIKAFPLVCVCLPQHWKKTIEGDGSTESGSAGGGPFQQVTV